MQVKKDSVTFATVAQRERSIFISPLDILCLRLEAVLVFSNG